MYPRERTQRGSPIAPPSQKKAISKGLQFFPEKGWKECDGYGSFLPGALPEKATITSSVCEENTTASSKSVRGHRVTEVAGSGVN